MTKYFIDYSRVAQHIFLMAVSEDEDSSIVDNILENENEETGLDIYMMANGIKIDLDSFSKRLDQEFDRQVEEEVQRRTNLKNAQEELYEKFNNLNDALNDLRNSLDQFYNDEEY
jgi:hypothetical protein